MATITLQFNGGTPATDIEPFAHLEQVFVPEQDDFADLADVNAMLAQVQAGLTAWEYLLRNCPYAYQDSNGVWWAELDFFVFPSSIDFEYSLQISAGVILPAVQGVHIPKSQDLQFNNSKQEQLDFIFSGSISRPMPFFKPDGTHWPLVTVDHSESLITLSKKSIVALRLDGVRVGFRHTLKINIFEDLTIEEALVVTELTTSETMKVDVPDCIMSRLNPCNDQPAPEQPKKWHVYYNGCNGDYIKSKYE